MATPRPSPQAHASHPTKREIDAQARALLNKPGWDPRRLAKTDAQTELRDMDQHSRNQRTYGQATSCQDCQAEQKQSGDQEALCQRHLAEAMGF